MDRLFFLPGLLTVGEPEHPLRVEVQKVAAHKVLPRTSRHAAVSPVHIDIARIHHLGMRSVKNQLKYCIRDRNVVKGVQRLWVLQNSIRCHNIIQGACALAGALLLLPHLKKSPGYHHRWTIIPHWTLIDDYLVFIVAQKLPILSVILPIMHRCCRKIREKTAQRAGWERGSPPPSET